MRSDTVCPICDKPGSECTCRKAKYDENKGALIDVLSNFLEGEEQILQNTRYGAVDEGVTWDNIEADDIAETIRHLLSVAEEANLTIVLGGVDPNKRNIKIEIPGGIDIVDFVNMVNTILDYWEERNG